ncbi:MAG TPA: OmpA family protein [Bacteroidales bacterium]|nr:OmpA family protein [Bacteroidales bacterium]HRX95657.1 OmpA family protein [Bacteroidales bacterium]
MKTIRFILLSLVIGCFQSLNAQSSVAKELYKQGEESYENGNYLDAASKFTRALAESPDYTDAMYYAASSYYSAGENEKAVKYFEKLEAADPSYFPWYLYLKGNAQADLGQHEAAIASLERFLEVYPEEATRTIYHHYAKYKLAYIKGQMELLKNPGTMADPVNLTTVVNSVADEYTPQIDPTGQRLYFTSQRKSRFSTELDEDGINWGEDVYYVEKVNGQWQSPVLLPEPINSQNNDFGSTFTGDGQTMVYVRCSAEDGVGSCDLYINFKDGDDWSEPINMGNVVNSVEWDSQPSISADGTKIIFASDREGGYGGSDLYLIEKNPFGDWGIPVNLGPRVNTPWTEKSPYIAPDGKTLYFSSYGHPGFGNADIFMSTLENNKWSDPVNLGQPLNSEGDDNYFTISASGEYAYFASTRAGGLGAYDLYQIDIPEELRPQPSVVVQGIVTNSKTGDPTAAWVLVEDLESGELIATNKSNSKSGKYLVVLPAGRNYSVSANKDGFFFYSQSFDVPADAKYQEITKDIELKPIEKGTKVVLNNIFFETGKADLKPESYLELAKAVELMNANPSMVVEVGGHTDNVGSDEANMKLSHDRAKSVRDFMVKAGVASERLMAKGYGETEPVASNETPEGRQANRRTEFVILEY